jgi:hypothetical protein
MPKITKDYTAITDAEGHKTITLPAPKAGAEDVVLDSPKIEIVSLDNLTGDGISINVRYTYPQGETQELVREVTTRLTFPELLPLLGEELFNSTLANMVLIAQTVLENLPEHKDKIEQL